MAAKKDAGSTGSIKENRFYIERARIEQIRERHKCDTATAAHTLAMAMAWTGCDDEIAEFVAHTERGKTSKGNVTLKGV